MATGAHSHGYSSAAPSSMRASFQNWGRPSTSMSSIADGNGTYRQTATESSMVGVWGRRSSGTPSSIAKASFTGAAAAAGLLGVVATNATEDPWWEKLKGLQEALAVMEAAIAQNTYLPQLLMYRDIKPPPPQRGNTPAAASAASQSAAGLDDGGLPNSISLTGAGSGTLSLPPPTPLGHRHSAASSIGVGGDSTFAGVVHSPIAGMPSTFGGGSTLRGGGGVSMAGSHSSVSGGTSRRQSLQLLGTSRQSSFMSTVSLWCWEGCNQAVVEPNNHVAGLGVFGFIKLSKFAAMGFGSCWMVCAVSTPTCDLAVTLFPMVPAAVSACSRP
eukprot:GHRR01014496.1.p1 GENE.GHRR01014496.1~~GHRR01014496.1.p1  ORF type:complete len:341 (+),score=88.58 GHRR01014496.1:37-1023(+)